MWNEVKKTIRTSSDSSIMQRAPYLSNVFYVSSYSCPTCQRAMYKTVFPVGGEYPISISNGKNCRMRRVFTCPECYYYATAAIDRLSDGLIYEHKSSNKSDYNILFTKLNAAGTTTPRMYD